MKHNLKILAPFADALMSGDKTFEVRKNNRGFQKGDTIIFQAIESDGTPYVHPINNASFCITYVLAGWGISDEYVVFSVARNAPDDPLKMVGDGISFTVKLADEEGKEV